VAPGESLISRPKRPVAVTVARGGFRVVGQTPLPADDAAADPWTPLEPLGAPAAGRAAPIPAILGQATAQWELKLGGVEGEFALAATRAAIPTRPAAD
jgi:hypothetical protein